MAFSTSSNSRARIRSCSPSRHRHTNVKGHTGTRDQLCLQVWMASEALSERLWFLMSSMFRSPYPAKACRERLNDDRAPRG